ncbi:MAG: GNAT superfamily N-acetyltransferase [Verrucomicrobiales bacterium]|jgi:GNAT superfamily N-acetyltransferase
MMQPATEDQDLRIEPATLEDLDDLTELVMDLFRLEEDFEPDRSKQEHGLKLVLEQPNRGRIFVVKTEHKIVAMVNLLFTISTAEGGMVILMEDLIVHPDHRRQGYGGRLLEHVVSFAQKRGFLRITLLTDRVSDASQEFFAEHGFGKSHMIPMRRTISQDKK